MLDGRFAMAAQNSPSSGGDAADNRNDALLAMPGATPVPQTNLYATAPGAEQTASVRPFTFTMLLPFEYNTNANFAPSNGAAAWEANPDFRLGYATQIAESNIRLSLLLRTDSEFYGPLPRNQDVNYLRGNIVLQYVNPDDDQAFSPYVSFAPRWTTQSFYRQEIGNRQDLNVGVQKRYNFDASLTRVPTAGRTGADTVWSFGVNVLAQQRFNQPLPSSQAVFAALSATYSFAPQWSAGLAVDLNRRWFNSFQAQQRQLFVVEPILTVEYSLSPDWAGSASRLFGSPAIDFQVSGEQNYSNRPQSRFGAFYVGLAFKTGFSF